MTVASRCSHWSVLAAALVAVGCGASTDVGFASGNEGDEHTYSGGLSPDCTTTADGLTDCPDERQRYSAWETYAVGNDGRTVTVTFTDVVAPCVEVAELHAEILPTEVHLTLSLLDMQQGCGDPVSREASVTLDELVAGRPVYSSVIDESGGGMASRGYAGSASGPQCHGPGRPAPGAFVNQCPAPTTAPPSPLRTDPDREVTRARVTPWTAITVAEDNRTLELQWISSDCARLQRVRVTPDASTVLLAVRESPCKGSAVVRSTMVLLDRPVGKRMILDATQAVR